MQRLGLAGHKNASYALLAQLGLLVLHFVLESATQTSNPNPLDVQRLRPTPASRPTQQEDRFFQTETRASGLRQRALRQLRA